MPNNPMPPSGGEFQASKIALSKHSPPSKAGFTANFFDTATTPNCPTYLWVTSRSSWS